MSFKDSQLSKTWQVLNSILCNNKIKMYSEKALNIIKDHFSTAEITEDLF